MQLPLFVLVHFVRSHFLLFFTCSLHYCCCCCFPLYQTAFFCQSTFKRILLCTLHLHYIGMNPAKFKDDCSAASFVILRSHSILIELKQTIENAAQNGNIFRFKCKIIQQTHTHCIGSVRASQRERENDKKGRISITWITCYTDISVKSRVVYIWCFQAFVCEFFCFSIHFACFFRIEKE